MKSAVLVKPNLKLFLCGALLVAVIGHLTGNGRSQGRVVIQARSAPGQCVSDSYLQALLDKAAENATAEVCMQISAAYEQRGDPRKALAYFRLASQLAEAEDR